jgi:hypothetical protein
LINPVGTGMKGEAALRVSKYFIIKKNTISGK